MTKHHLHTMKLLKRHETLAGLEICMLACTHTRNWKVKRTTFYMSAMNTTGSTHFPDKLPYNPKTDGLTDLKNNMAVKCLYMVMFPQTLEENDIHMWQKFMTTTSHHALKVTHLQSKIRRLLWNQKRLKHLDIIYTFGCIMQLQLLWKTSHT